MSDPIKYYTICYPGEVGQHVQETFSEEQILRSYWDYWSENMRNISASPDKVSRENWIIDWIWLHSACASDKFGKVL